MATNANPTAILRPGELTIGRDIIQPVSVPHAAGAGDASYPNPHLPSQFPRLLDLHARGAAIAAKIREAGG